MTNKYYRKNKEKPRKEARQRYKDISITFYDKATEKRRKKAQERY